MHIHPGYNPCDLCRDIAVAEISENIYVDGVPICMPTEKEELPTNFVVAGYGFNPYDKLRRLLHSVNLTYYRLNWSNEILTLTSGKSICRGDSGGPLFKSSDLKAILIGISSANNGPCEEHEPPEVGVIARLARNEGGPICSANGSGLVAALEGRGRAACADSSLIS
ncbi:unnamed protein product [Angiostrongylus costaricensis]|uniref:Peptidase S1 domain-containing protein n=1 Tax=Angiostrongylus costaricensis TaxID=334426 RepID=A0A158PMH3_ANGCS|nr:unnamed protein product [Angiostrongylus costaricensis]